MKYMKCKTRGHYVYAWLDDGAVFYIGRGTGIRYKENHKAKGGLAYCELWKRRIGDRFSIVIVQDNLTDEGATLVEQVLIKLIRPACNHTVSSGRKDRPPLVLARDVLALFQAGEDAA
jgi:hypothetical protein